MKRMSTAERFYRPLQSMRKALHRDEVGDLDRWTIDTARRWSIAAIEGKISCKKASGMELLVMSRKSFILQSKLELSVLALDASDARNRKTG